MAQRVLLVHANPLQRMLPVPPYGLERIRTAAVATGADVELLEVLDGVLDEAPVARGVASD